jgi:hypothetical protein
VEESFAFALWLVIYAAFAFVVGGALVTSALVGRWTWRRTRNPWTTLFAAVATFGGVGGGLAFVVALVQ